MASEQKTLKAKLAWSAPIEYSSDNAASVPKKPGVYEIIVKLKDNGGKRRYVGESDDLRTRFSQHLQDDEPNKCVKDKVRNKTSFFRYVEPIESKDDRKDVEKKLYDLYEHECNSPPNGQPPPGSGREVVTDLTEIPADEIVRLP